MNNFVVGNKKKRRSPIGLITSLTLIALVSAGCSVGAGGSGVVEAELKVRSYKTEAVAKQKIGNPVEQVAQVEAGNVLNIVSKANGEVVELLVNRGAYVEKGDILFRLDTADALSAKQKGELSLRSAQQSLQKAKEDLTNNRKNLVDAVERASVALNNVEQDYNKIRNEFDTGKATDRQVELSKQQVDNTRMTLESAQNSLKANDNNSAILSYETQAESAKMAVDDANRMLENYNVKAPSSGLLTDFSVVLGQTVMNSSQIGQIQQVDPIKIKTELTESHVALVKDKQELTYYNPSNPDQKGTAKVSYLAPIMSAQTKSYTLELEVPNPQRSMVPGTRVMVQLTTTAEQSVIAVPILSILREASDTFVYVQQADQYQKRKVKLGRTNGSFQEVLEGVKEGELLVVTGQHQLKDGQKVETK